MKRLIQLGLMLFVCAFNANAQVEPGSFGIFNEALLFSRTSQGGTARIQGLGGGQVALGGDMSSANSNPAGLGFYNRSVFSFTPSLNFHSSDTEFLGTNTNNFKNNFNFNNLGIVFNNSKRDLEEGKFRGGSFAISINRINDFHNEFRYDGVNNSNSVIDFFLQQSAGIAVGNIANRGALTLAYDNFLINPVANQTGVYDSFVLGFPRQVETVKTSGAQYQWNFSYGANYDDKLYFGGGIGINSINYKQEKIYRESEFIESDGSPDLALRDLTLNETLDINGIGINATLGIIYRPVNTFRWGVSLTTPTFFSMNEESFSDLATNYNDFYYAAEDTTLTSLFSESPITTSNYRLRTPMKLNTGVAIFFGKRGFVTADVEFVDYSNAQFKSDDFSVTADNRTIENLYGSTMNYRVGGEIRADIFRFRAGYNYLGDPFNNGSIDRSIQRYSGGIGIRMRDYFIDLAVINTKSNGIYSPYTLDIGNHPVANISNNSTNVAVTVGFNF